MAYPPLLVQRFAHNDQGDDYVIGDIHGCFSRLSETLRRAGFRTAVDRLFCVGDLIDRGPDSAEVLDWLAQPWFHSIAGNHELLMVGVEEGVITYALHEINGGAWTEKLNVNQRRTIANELARLPWAIELQIGSDKIGLVHAEIVGDDWDQFVADLEGRNFSMTDEGAVFWSRRRIKARDESPVKNVSSVIVGHTPVSEFTWLGNVLYIDMGACYGRKFQLFNLTRQVITEEP